MSRSRRRSLRMWPGTSLVGLVLACSSSSAHAQLVNGQCFTSGLTIVDAPQTGSTRHAGFNLPIALDLSGNGKLAQTSFVASSGSATCYSLLEVYLINEELG